MTYIVSNWFERKNAKLWYISLSTDLKKKNCKIYILVSPDMKKIFEIYIVIDSLKKMNYDISLSTDLKKKKAKLRYVSLSTDLKKTNLWYIYNVITWYEKKDGDIYFYCLIWEKNYNMIYIAIAWYGYKKQHTHIENDISPNPILHFTT